MNPEVRGVLIVFPIPIALDVALGSMVDICGRNGEILHSLLSEHLMMSARVTELVQSVAFSQIRMSGPVGPGRTLAAITPAAGRPAGDTKEGMKMAASMQERLKKIRQAILSAAGELEQMVNAANTLGEMVAASGIVVPKKRRSGGWTVAARKASARSRRSKARAKKGDALSQALKEVEKKRTRRKKA